LQPRARAARRRLARAHERCARRAANRLARPERRASRAAPSAWPHGAAAHRRCWRWQPAEKASEPPCAPARSAHGRQRARPSGLPGRNTAPCVVDSLRVRPADMNVTTTCRAEPSHADGGWAGGRRRSDGYRCTPRPKTQYRCTPPRKPRSRGQQPPAPVDENAPENGRGVRASRRRSRGEDRVEWRAGGTEGGRACVHAGVRARAFAIELSSTPTARFSWDSLTPRSLSHAHSFSMDARERTQPQ
jgi:hypothetical protein